MRHDTRGALRASVVGLLFLAAAPAAALAQQLTREADDSWCDRDWSSDRERYCEVRAATLAPRDELVIDAEPNGGIRVEAWDRDEILVRARVTSSADTREEARAIADRVRIDVRGAIRADGPNPRDDRYWSVSYRIFVPRRADLDLDATNGGLTIAGVQGRMRLRTVNGGIHLDAVGGDVRGRTTNGGVTVQLTGDRWAGAGLDIATTNGGVRIQVPERYSARLVTGTVNGGVRLDFPILVQGRIDRTIDTTLGDGGPTIRVATTNGGVTVERR